MVKASCFLLQIESEILELKNLLLFVSDNFRTRSRRRCEFCTHCVSRCETVGLVHLSEEKVQNFALATKLLRNAPKCVLFLNLLARSFLHGPNSIQLFPWASKVKKKI